MEKDFVIKNNELIKYNGTEKVVRIPDNIKEIASNAFFCKRNIEKIILPKNLKLISSNAFQYCEDLKEINLPNALNHIGIEAFNNCTSLEEITIPPNLKKVNIFLSNNKNLKKIIINGNYTNEQINNIIGDNNINLTEVIGSNIICKDGVVYNIDKKYLIKYLESKKDEYFKIPNEVENIESYSIYKNKYLKILELNDNLKTIKDNGINNKTIEEIKINSKLKNIEFGSIILPSLKKDIDLRKLNIKYYNTDFIILKNNDIKIYLPNCIKVINIEEDFKSEIIINKNINNIEINGDKTCVKTITLDNLINEGKTFHKE